MDYTSVRQWQVQFEVHRPLASLPEPDLVVEEVQKNALYRCDGRRRRSDSGSQISITLEGRGAIRLHGVDHPLTPGRAFLHNHNDPEVCYYYPADARGDWRFLWMSFDGAPIETMVDDLVARYGYLYEVAPDSPLVEKLMSFKSYQQQIQVLPPLEGANLVIDCLSMLCSSLESRLRESPRSSLVRQVQTVIAGELAERLDVGRLARRFQLSREHLSRLFRDQTGITLHEYITRMRMRTAVDLLLQTRLTAKEIAVRCGYSEYSIFYRTFRKCFGRSPDELRGSGRRPGQ